jgi:LmbE family N-acetylglucosaminyl deacetylase
MGQERLHTVVIPIRYLVTMTMPFRRGDGRDLPVLVVVHAHPDDESSSTGGTLARYAALGHRTVLVTCTDGRLGDAADGAKPGQPGHDPDEVARRRALELDDAAAILGVSEVVKLGYPDSGVDADGAPDAFSRRPMAPMVEQLAGLLRLHRPDVVITYPPNGLSGHPDHIRTHDVVAAVHRDLVAEGEAPRLYYVALSRSRVKALQDHIEDAVGDDGFAPPDDMAVDDDTITTVIDVEPYWQAKLAGLAAHSSQADAAMLLQMFSLLADVAAGTHRVEEYVRAFPLVTGTEPGIERDLFQ